MQLSPGKIILAIFLGAVLLGAIGGIMGDDARIDRASPEWFRR